VISRKEVDRYIKLTNNFIKQLRRIRGTKQRKIIATSVILDIIIQVTANSVEAVGMLEYAKQALVSITQDEYRLKMGETRPSEAIV